LVDEVAAALMSSDEEESTKKLNKTLEKFKPSKKKEKVTKGAQNAKNELEKTTKNFSVK
jgi:hypothetical protein